MNDVQLTVFAEKTNEKSFISHLVRFTIDHDQPSVNTGLHTRCFTWEIFVVYISGDAGATPMSWMDVPGDKLLEPLVDMVRSVLFETYSIVFSLCNMPGLEIAGCLTPQKQAVF